MVSTIDFVLTGHLNGLALGDNKASFLSQLCQPSWWEGMPSVDYDQSSLWQYGPIQIVFDSRQKAVALTINFNDEREGSSPLSESTPCLNSDMDMPSFVEFLADQKATYVESTDSAGKQLISVDGGAVAKFSRKTDHERSVAEGCRVRSELSYLVSLRVGEGKFFKTLPSI